ncbi:hypothetical protein BC936DRAFT_137472 [Jimgerdemannia flammicorona]|uniref:Uncharacterized protein n=2 Tax=Jimgerdemannia flammicorona TaxID=994334 RepID=A0A433CXA7_9FUNG|nr:hypothetical protein BC936DRAFT_137472 [Jimgerdemannia flammicorona]RUS34996.1 hypothetical protein BC938DRAFT_477090 [Jimgerdemannia flammicorona]
MGVNGAGSGSCGAIEYHLSPVRNSSVYPFWISFRFWYLYLDSGADFFRHIRIPSLNISTLCKPQQIDDVSAVT